MMKRLLFILSIVLGTVGVAWGQNTTTEVSTVEGLKEAIANATDGETIELAAGTYDQTTVTISKDILLVGAGADKTIINGHYVVKTANAEDVVSFGATGISFVGNSNSATTGIIGITGVGVGKAKLTDCKISGGAPLTAAGATTGVRMESKKAELTLENTDIDVRYYGIGVRNEEQKVIINGGKIMAWGAIMTSAGGLDAASKDGSLADTKVSITATNTHFISSVIAMGNSNGYGALILQQQFNGVTAKFEGCTIETGPSRNDALNSRQTTAVDIRSYNNNVTFSNCTLSAEGAENNGIQNAGLDSETRTNAAVIRLGWVGADFGGANAGVTPVSSDKSVPTKNTITLTGCTLNGKAGEKHVVSYRRDINQQHDVLTINGTLYSVEAGNIFRLYQKAKDNKTIVDDAGKAITDLASVYLMDAIKYAADGTTVNIAAGTYTLPTALTIDKSITLQGAGADKTIIKGVLNIDASTTLKKLAIQASTAKATGVVNVRADNTSLKVYDCEISQNAAGNADGWGGMTFALNVTNASGKTPENATVELYNSKLNLNDKYQRGIAYGESGAEKTILLLDNSQIIGKDNPENMTYCRGVSFAGMKTPELTIRNKSRIEGVYYAVNLSTDTGTPIVTIDDSFIAGFAAFNIWDSNCVIDVKNGSVLEGRNSYLKGSNDFATIVINSDEEITAKNNVITITDSEIRNVMTSTALEYLIDIRGDGNNIINLEGSTTLTTTNAKLGYLIDIVGTTNKINVKPTVKFLNETEKGVTKPTLIIVDKDGNFRNASILVSDAIAYGVSFKGDMVLATDTTTTLALSSLNATEVFFAESPYIIPDGIIINCKDAYLVTGKEATQANAFAETVTDKPVFWLQQGDKSFTTTAVKAKRIVIAGHTTWNDATNANRSVQIKTGATLTINADMPLDSVIMEGSAQLQTAMRVTAKMLQYTYPAKKYWKAFGFPVATPTVADAKGNAISAPNAGDATTGVWMGVMNTEKTTAPAFTLKTDAFASVGLIAADKDSNLVVSYANATPFSLTTKGEEAAPNADTKFKFVANPNTFAMTLSQTAYVLDDAGKFFVRTENPTIAPFQSYILADEGTTSTLRSLKVDGGIPTGNDIVPTDGYYVQAVAGAIIIRSNEPVQVQVADMTGRVMYNGLIATDGYRIELPAGIYAVNRQLVRVK